MTEVEIETHGDEPVEHATVRRHAERGRYHAETVNAILDEGMICHVGFVWDGRPVVIPTSFARVGDVLYLHGSPASRMLRTLGDGIDCCVTVTLVDGLVLARSAFSHSMNYRSVVLFGHARPVGALGEKATALDAFVEHIIAGRAAHLRPTTEKELRATLVLALPIEAASAKVRSGPPLDDEEDYGLPIWAGVLPYAPAAGEPEADPRLHAGLATPDHVLDYRRPPG
ncbi:MAG: pyridoxamine 5'-phosphate oxidase family protein [Acidimicrobiia bacterium]|nr:pyridoxamine 5'-phosphate oxidase family protein [Acidimicrobiia bacterium]